MVEINLITWRTQKNEYEKNMVRVFMLVGCLIAALFVSGAHYLMMNIIDKQTRSVSLLGARLPGSRHEEVTTEHVEKFQSPAEFVKILNAVSQSARFGVCYQKISLDAARATLLGKARTVMSVTWALHDLEVANIYGNIVLQDVKQLENNLLQFSFNAGDI